MTPIYGGYPLELVNGQPVLPTLVLASRGGNKIGVINNVDDKFVSKFNLNAVNEISFDVYKTMGDTECFLWDSITDFKLVYIPSYRAWYEITVTLDEDMEGSIIKSVTGTHLEETELSQYLLYDIQINTEDDIDRDDYEATVFYNPAKPKASLLHRLLADKAPHYTIYHVDDSLKNIQRTFEYDSTSIYDALMDVAEEIGCLFVFGEAQTDDGVLTRSISAYDLQTVCLNCGHRGDTVMVNGQEVCAECGSANLNHGYGNDTAVFVSAENLAERLTYSGDPDSVKTCFKLEAGDDLMTATVVNCNPNGSSYIWFIPDYLREDMSAELRTKLDQYDATYDDYMSTYQMDVPEAAINQYNTLIDKYKVYVPELVDTRITYPITGYSSMMNAYYDAMDLYDILETTLMPASPVVTDTTAAAQAAKLTNATMSPIAVSSTSALSLATANSSIVSYAKIYVDTSRYKVDINTGSLSGTTWTGTINVTSYTKEDDTANTSTLTIRFNTDLETFIQQKMDKVMSNEEDKDLSMSTLLSMPMSTTAEVNAFREELNRYSLSYLQIINSACDACLDVLIDNGCGSKSHDMYSVMYQPMVKRSKQILAEIKERENELKQLRTESATGKALLDYIDSERARVRNALNMATYLGDTLWAELASYRRDDTYANDNYKSDNLTNAEIIDLAQQFLTVATHEIIKSATQQHSVTSTLQDLLVLPEFAPIVGHFELGNFIRVKIDETVYRLRLATYQIDYSRPEALQVTFTDVQAGEGFVSDVQSILSQARSMATSYNYVAKQASNGTEAQKKLDTWVKDGLNLTNMTIVSDADNQDVMITEQGIQLRRYYDDVTGYDDEQIKIINNGLYYTTDAWESVSAGIGHFQYADPADDFAVKDGYGVIADTIVGNIILGNSVGIYNPNSTFSATADGVTIKANGDDGSAIFKIQDSSGNNLLQMTNDGKLDIVVNSFALSSGETFDDKYATCSTAAGTAAKIASCSGFVLKTGVRIAVLFSNANTAANPTLNINGTGAQPIWAKGATLTAAQYWSANSLITFTYDGATPTGHWVMELDDQTETFKRLTNNATTGTGNAQGIYLKNGKIYINASQIDTGVLNADLITAGSMSAARITSGTMSAARISGGTLTLGGASNGNGTFALQNASGTNIVTMNNTGITAIAGKIGGFTIGSSAIYNGMTKLADTTHNGIWLGTDGIALGKGAFKVTNTGALTSTSGSIGNFVIGTNSLTGYNAMTSGTSATQYQVYLGAPASVSASSVAMVVRRRTYNGSTYGDWYNNFRVRYDGLVQITSPSESGKCISGSSLVNGTVARNITINNGRLIVYRDETLNGTTSSYWTGYMTSGTYSASSTNHTRFMALTTYKTNVIGFGVVESGTISEPSNLSFFYYGLEKTTFADSTKTDGVMVCNRELWMQTCNIRNANYVYCVRVNESSDERLKNSIAPISEDVLRRISAVDIKQFRLNTDKSGTTYYGVIAQDVQKAMGDMSESLVSSSSNVDGQEYLSVNYTGFLTARIAADEHRIATLEQRITKLEQALLSLGHVK